MLEHDEPLKHYAKNPATKEKPHWTVHFKSVNFTVYELHLSKAIILRKKQRPHYQSGGALCPITLTLIMIFTIY